MEERQRKLWVELAGELERLYVEYYELGKTPGIVQAASSFAKIMGCWKELRSHNEGVGR